MKRLTIKCVVCIMFGIMFGIANKLENMKVGYWVMSKICKGGGQNMFPYFRGYFFACGGIPYILGYYVTLFIPKNRPQNCFSYIHRIV